MFPHHPFVMDDKHHDVPSRYEADFVNNGVRYTYGFESGHKGVHSEWLYEYRTGRPRTLFQRDGLDISFGRSLGGENQRIARLLTPKTLYLSLASMLHHASLGPVATHVRNLILYTQYGEGDQKARLDWVWNELEKDDDLRLRAVTMLRLADLGVSGIDLHREPDRVKADERKREKEAPCEGPGGWGGEPEQASHEKEP